MSDEQAFLDTISAAPDDEAPHKVFADWLDEHDRPEEADWHRAWTTAGAKEAREWFGEFAKGHTDPYRGDRPYTAADIMECAEEYLRSGERHTQDGGESLQDEMYETHTRETFWRNYALASGTFVPAAVAEDGYVFSCTC